MGQPATVLAATQRPDGYARRRPEATVLYRTVAKHWPAFLEKAEDAGGLPRFVVREFEEYLRCGVLEHGCLELECESCGESYLVGFSCKKRGFCPSCIGRRMAETAVHLEERVLPMVPIRHWVVTFPWGLRALLGYDRELCSEVVRAFVGEVSRSLRRRAKQHYGLASMAMAHTGAVAAVQRTDSALRLNVHPHVLAIDGVYLRKDDDAPLGFFPLPTPSRAEVAQVAHHTAKRIQRLLEAHGRKLDPEMQGDDDELPPLLRDEPGLAACYATAAQGVSVKGEPTLRLITSPQASTQDRSAKGDEPVAEVCGVNVHAKEVVDGRDRKRLERLCRYVTRPPLPQQRLAQLGDGRLELTLKSLWRDGTRALVFEPHDLLARLVAAIPPPRFHLLRYFGLLSSHCSARAEVVPKPTTLPQPTAPGDQLELFHRAFGSPTRKRWAWLLAHVFQADLEKCPRCGGRMRWREIATESDVIARLCAAHDLGPEPRPRPPPRSPPGQLRLPLVQ